MATANDHVYSTSYHLKIYPSSVNLFKAKVDTSEYRDVRHCYIDFHLKGAILIDDLIFEPDIQEE